LKKTLLAFTSITFAIGTVLTVNAAPLNPGYMDNIKSSYLSADTLDGIGATFALMIASIAIALGFILKSLSK